MTSFLPAFGLLAYGLAVISLLSLLLFLSFVGLPTACSPELLSRPLEAPRDEPLLLPMILRLSITARSFERLAGLVT